jgi:hypothetical protein
MRAVIVAMGLIVFGLLPCSTCVADPLGTAPTEPAHAARTTVCSEISMIAKMARSGSVETLVESKVAAGNSYRANAIFATQLFRLQPTAENARLILSYIPKDEKEYSMWEELSDSLCDEESVADMGTLGKLEFELLHQLSRAVLLVPNHMAAYVRFSTMAVSDPNSDYAVQMQAVCQAQRANFLKAVNSLPLGQRYWFEDHIFDVNKCRALALPEAD